MRRFVSVWLPLWPIERLERARPGVVPRDRPFALVASRQSARLIKALNGAGFRAGLRVGQPLADARAAHPGLVSAPAEPEADARALTKLALWAERYGPWRNVDDADGLWVDVSGVAHLFGGERALLDDLLARLGGFGFTARAGLADTPGAAWALARFATSRKAPYAIAPIGKTRTALAGLPVAGLRLEGETIALLRRLGLRRIGQLYDLPRVSLKRRFAAKNAEKAVLMRLDQLLGKSPEPLRPIVPAPRFIAHRLFPEPLVSSKALEAVLERLVAEVCAALAKAHMGARRCRLTIHRSDNMRAHLTVAMGAPCRDRRHIVRLFRERLDRLDAGFGIDMTSLAVLRSEPLPGEQKALVTGAQNRAREPLSALLDRLRNRLGEDRVFWPGLAPSHMPERAGPRLRAPGPRQPESGPPWHTARPPLLLARPEPVDVLAAVPEGPPVLMRWRRLRRRIVKAQGPERIAPEWWRHIDEAGQPPTRDYYHLEDTEGRRYWVFRAGLYGKRENEAQESLGKEPPRWYLHGLFC